jgi:hypothetical protein
MKSKKVNGVEFHIVSSRLDYKRLLAKGVKRGHIVTPREMDVFRGTNSREINHKLLDMKDRFDAYVIGKRPAISVVKHDESLIMDPEPPNIWPREIKALNAKISKKPAAQSGRNGRCRICGAKARVGLKRYVNEDADNRYDKDVTLCKPHAILYSTWEANDVHSEG